MIIISIFGNDHAKSPSCAAGLNRQGRIISLNYYGKYSVASLMRTPLLAVDAVILFGNGIVLIKRDRPPYQGCYALPGGFVEVGETVEDAAKREAKEETGLDIELQGLVGVYSDPGRDPRGHVVSLAFLARGMGTLRSGSDARAAEVVSITRLPDLAFDHDKIIRDALRPAEMEKDSQFKVE
jgi:8-oxo-dGTP diphosphatase